MNPALTLLSNIMRFTVCNALRLKTEFVNPPTSLACKYWLIVASVDFEMCLGPLVTRSCDGVEGLTASAYFKEMETSIHLATNLNNFIMEVIGTEYRDIETPKDVAAVNYFVNIPMKKS